MPGSIHVFGPFRFDADRMLLLRDGAPVTLGGRAAAILAALLARPGDVVGREELMTAAWPDTAVEESNLSVQISQLRRTVGEGRIGTVERVGYRWLADRPASPSRASWHRDAFPSIAVLTAGSSGADLTREVTDNVATCLARFKSLRVMARPHGNAASRGSTRELGTDYVAVLSHNRRSGLTATLSDGGSSIILWADSFEVAEDTGVEERIAASIESEVQAAEMVRGARDSGPFAEAYSLYLRGRRALHSSRADDNRRALTLLMAATKLEPENAAYLAAATEAMHHRLAVGWEALAADDKRVAREFAYRTLEVANGDAVAIALVGNAMFTVDEEDLGLALCRRALAMNPTSHLVLACAQHAESWGGSMEEVERIANHAIAIAPNDPGQRFALGGMASVALWRGDYEAALGWARRSLAFGPGYAGAHLPIVDALVRLGRQAEAERHLAHYLAMSPGVTIASLERGQHNADRSRLQAGNESLRRAGMPER